MTKTRYYIDYEVNPNPPQIGDVMVFDGKNFIPSNFYVPIIAETGTSFNISLLRNAVYNLHLTGNATINIQGILQTGRSCTVMINISSTSGSKSITWLSGGSAVHARCWRDEDQLLSVTTALGDTTSVGAYTVSITNIGSGNNALVISYIKHYD